MGGGLFLLNYVALYIQMFGAELTFDFGFFFFFFVSVAALWETRNYSQEIKMEKKYIYTFAIQGIYPMTCSRSLLCAFKSDNNVTVKCQSSDKIFPQVLSCLEFLSRCFLMAAVMQLIKKT